MKLIRQVKRYGAGAVLAAVAGQSMAAVPAEVQTAVDTGKTDATTIAVGVFLIIVAIAAIKWLRKAL